MMVLKITINIHIWTSLQWDIIIMGHSMFTDIMLLLITMNQIPTTNTIATSIMVSLLMDIITVTMRRPFTSEVEWISKRKDLYHPRSTSLSMISQDQSIMLRLRKALSMKRKLKKTRNF